METVKSRSESPFSRNKVKSHALDTSENGDGISEQIKRKKKNRNKCKPQSNGKEAGDLVNNGNDYADEEKATTNETDNNVESSNGEHENGINNGESIENGNGTEETPEIDETEMDVLVSSCDSSEEKIINESNGRATENGTTEEDKCTEAVDVEEESPEQCGNSETESGAKKDNFTPCDSLAESEVLCESSGETCNGGANDVANGETHLTQQGQESTADCSEIKESSQISVNGSDGGSHYEEAIAADDHIQASPDTATRDDNSLSNKITNFLGKWSQSQEQKQDPNVSSSKRAEESPLSHPYLSKVSGRRGIKDRLNSSATVFNSVESKTPENAGKISLDDSFRVRTNPPRLPSSDLMGNPTLRKFKGKRCLNTGDEPEEEDDTYGSSVKRRKLERNQEPGLLGGILWSPFRKRALDNEDQMKLATAESKLSRLLSPFWFWKRTAAGQKGK